MAGVTVTLGTPVAGQNNLYDFMTGASAYAGATPSYDNYLLWLQSAAEDGEITKREAQSWFGDKLGKRVYKAIKNSNRSVINKATKNYARRAYIKDSKLHIQGENDFLDSEYEAAKYKGIGEKDVIKKYNDDIKAFRKNAKIIYKKGPDNKWHYYIEGKFEDTITSPQNSPQLTASTPQDTKYIDVTDSAWVTEGQKRQAQSTAYGQAVDAEASADDSQYTKYKEDSKGYALLREIGWLTDDRKKELEDWDNLGKTEDGKLKQKELQDSISSALIAYHNSLYKNNTWLEGIHADAWWKKLMSIYNTKKIAWIKDLQWHPNGRYNEYLHGGPGTTGTTTAVGNYLGFSKQGGSLKARALAKGGNIIKAGFGALLADWTGVDELKYIDDVAEFVPVVSTLNKGVGAIAGHNSWGDVALSAGLDALGPLAKVAKGVYNGVKLANASAKVVKTATKTVKTAEKAAKASQNAANKVTTLVKQTAHGKSVTYATKTAQDNVALAQKTLEGSLKTGNKVAIDSAKKAVVDAQKKLANALKKEKSGTLQDLGKQLATHTDDATKAAKNLTKAEKDLAKATKNATQKGISKTEEVGNVLRRDFGDNALKVWKNSTKYAIKPGNWKWTGTTWASRGIGNYVYNHLGELVRNNPEGGGTEEEYLLNVDPSTSNVGNTVYGDGSGNYSDSYAQAAASQMTPEERYRSAQVTMTGYNPVITAAKNGGCLKYFR